jgi:hypothetical protein
MKKERIIEVVERMIQDKNYMLNDGKGNEKLNYAWEYSREDLKIVLSMLKDMEEKK